MLHARNIATPVSAAYLRKTVADYVLLVNTFKTAARKGHCFRLSTGFGRMSVGDTGTSSPYLRSIGSHPRVG